MDFEEREKYFHKIFKWHHLSIDERMQAIGKLLTDLYIRLPEKCECGRH